MFLMEMDTDILNKILSSQLIKHREAECLTLKNILM